MADNEELRPRDADKGAGGSFKARMKQRFEENLVGFVEFWRELAGKPIDVSINPALPMIQVVDYTKKFGKFLANNKVSFDVGHGVIHGFIGPNGSGKTTTMKTLIGAYTLQDGKMLVNGHKPGSIKAKTILGYIPERASFPGHLNCIDYLAEMGAMSGMKYSAAKKKGYEILTDLGLVDHAKRKPITFSSGMQKKILLAQALLNDPALLILDEPAANLDPTARKELLTELIKLRNAGKTIFISSHILSELERIVDEVTFLFYGEVLFTGKIEAAELKTQRAFFRTNDNEKAAAALTKAGFKVQGDAKTEMFVECASVIEAEQVLVAITNVPGMQVKLFKTNDLQTIYEVMLSEALKRNRGNQKIGSRKVRAERYGAQ